MICAFTCASCCLQVLKFETARQPHLLGGSVFGYNDAYKRLHSFLRKWRAAQAGAAEPSPDSPPPLRQPSCGLSSPVTQHTQHRMLFVPPEVATAATLSSHQRSSTQEAAAAAAAADMVTEGTASRVAGGVPYIVSVDISRAFDNIDADKLLGIIEPLLRSPEYLIVKYAEVVTMLTVQTMLAAATSSS